jgi:hypothetical protein
VIPDSDLGPIAGRQELVPTFQQQIVANHQRGLELDAELGRVLLERCNNTRETGLLLRTAENQLLPREWRALKASLPFCSDAIAAYRSFAERSKDKPFDDLKVALRSIKDALRTTEALPLLPGHSEQQLHGAEPNYFVGVTFAISKIVLGFRRYCRQLPLKKWDRQTAELFLRSLKPLLEVHREVALWLKSKT